MKRYIPPPQILAALAFAAVIAVLGPRHPVAAFWFSIICCTGMAVLCGWHAHKAHEARDALVLAYLFHGGESYGLALAKAGAGSDRTIHRRLRRLEREGLLSSREDGAPEVLAQRGGRPRRLYRLTLAGETWYRGHFARLKARHGEAFLAREERS